MPTGIRSHLKEQMSRYARSDSLRPYDTYLSYHDVAITKEDVDTLKDDWLTDNIISFWEEYLEREVLHSQHPTSRVVLLRPSMGMMLKTHPDPASLTAPAGPLSHLPKATHLFIPINDNPDPTLAEGGTHWSLLVVGVSDRIALHYDSNAAMNLLPAKTVASKLQVALGRELVFRHLEDTPQQRNGSDCGVHLCWAIKHLLVRRLLKVEREKEVDMGLGGKVLDAVKMRREMGRIIEGFRKKANRSVSPMAKNGDPPRIGREAGTGSE